MPYYGRRKTVYRRPFKKNNKKYNKNPNSTRNLAIRALSKVNKLRSNLDIEYKFKDSDSFGTVGTTAAFGNIAAIAEGDTNQTRNGRSVKMTSVYSRGTVRYNTSATTETTFRIIIFAWFDEAAPTASDILTDTAEPMSFFRVSDRKQYRVLFSKFITLDSQRPLVKWRSFKKLNMKQIFGGAASTDYKTGSIHMMVISSDATNQPTYDWVSRVRYVDN